MTVEKQVQLPDLDAFEEVSTGVNPGKNIVETIEEGKEKEVKEPEIKEKQPENKVEETKVEEKEEENEVQSNEETEEEASLVPFAEKIFVELGIGDKFKPELLEKDNVEGLTDLIKKVIDANKGVDYSDPIVKEFNEYIAQGGDPKKFLTTHFSEEALVDYNKLEKDKLTVDDKKELITKFYEKTTKFSKDKIVKQIKLLEDAEQLDDLIDDAISYLDKDNKDQKVKLTKEIEERKQKEVLEHKQMVEGLKKDIKELKEVFTYPITEKDQAQLEEYVLKQDSKTGMTKYQQDLEKYTNARLVFAFLTMKGLNPKFIENKVGTDMAKRLQKNLSRHTDTTSTGNTVKIEETRKDKVNLEDFVI